MQKSYLKVLALVSVTFFVTYSQAQQQPSKLSDSDLAERFSDPRFSDSKLAGKISDSKVSKTSTVNQTVSDLLRAAKYLPKILDNKKIDFAQPSSSPPGEFLVNKTFGPGSGGGGNSCAMGIVKLTKDLLSRGLNRASLTPTQQRRLLVAMKTATFAQGDNLPEVRGEKKNAINFPDQKLVVVDQKACELMIAGNSPGLSLLMHEYMGLAGIDDRDYRASLSFVEELFREDPARYGKPIVNSVFRADEYMKSYKCLPGQSWAACLYSAGAKATKEMYVVLNQLSACVDKNSTGLIDNPKAKLLEEQKAFWQYADSKQSYLPQNGPHEAQSLHAARLLLILERTDLLKESLQFCAGSESR